MPSPGGCSAPCCCRPAGPPVEVAAAAAACAPSRPRSRHSAPSTLVRRRRLAVSGPLSVRVGRSAAVRGPSAGVLQGTPGNPYSARHTPLSRRRRLRAVCRSGVRCTAIEATRVPSSARCSEPTTTAGRRTTGRGRGSGGGMCTVAPAISAFGPVHARQAPPSGRQRTPRSFSVAANNSCRLRCRCSASAGLRTHEWLQACGYFKGRVADQLDESEQRGVVR